MKTTACLALGLLLAGCGFVTAGEEPVIEAHRGAAGYWPQNSATAMYESIAAGYDGLEFDLALTSEGVPVLSHDPWLHETLCTTANGEALGERLLLMDLTLEALLEGYVCGGVPDPEQPDALVVAEPVMTFDELLLALEASDPDMVVHIDVKYEPGHTPPPADFAEEILSRYVAAELPNPWYVSANLPQALRAFASWGDEHDLEVPLSLAWPRFPPDAANVPIALESELVSTLGLTSYASLAEDARAQGLAIPYQVLERSRAQAARRQGLAIQVWTVNDPALLARYQRWPVDAIITDYPEDAE